MQGRPRVSPVVSDIPQAIWDPIDEQIGDASAQNTRTCVLILSKNQVHDVRQSSAQRLMIISHRKPPLFSVAIFYNLLSDNLRRNIHIV